MPELPEVEVVRRGLAQWIVDSSIAGVEVLHPRPVRAHEAGPGDFAASLTGSRIQAVVRRGKFAWLLLADPEEGAQPDRALVIHLGMSGQMVLQPADAEVERHLRVHIRLDGGLDRGGRHLRFIDQRMFGGLRIDPLVTTRDGAPGGLGSDLPLLPVSAAHIARDALDPALDEAALVARLRTRNSAIKRALLDQGLVSGIGNIYADEALCLARVHGERLCTDLSARKVREVLAASQSVMRQALAEGGTSFDSLYVDVNGQSGYFERSLQAYGRAGKPCGRCGSIIRRDVFMNRSSFTCPKCQKRAPSRG